MHIFKRHQNSTSRHPEREEKNEKKSEICAVLERRSWGRAVPEEGGPGEDGPGGGRSLGGLSPPLPQFCEKIVIVVVLKIFLTWPVEMAQVAEKWSPARLGPRRMGPHRVGLRRLPNVLSLSLWVSSR